MDLSGVSVAVIGLGASGVAAARLALSEGGEVYVSESRQDAAAAARGAELGAAGASVDLGGHDVERVARAGLVVVSPGIPPDAPVLVELAARGVRWISEPELAARFHAGSLIAVTGTNGKTTVTLLVEHLLREAGVHAGAGGNVGGGLAPAASDLVGVAEPYDWWVLEMSSFQLAGVETFRPDIGVVTNLSPDHLDRYASVEAYYADKARLFDTADARSRWVLPWGDAAVDRLIGDAPGRRYWFESGAGAEAGGADVRGGARTGGPRTGGARTGGAGAGSVPGPAGSPHARVEGDRLVLQVADQPEELCAVGELPLLGAHNVVNALTASLTARLAGARPDAIASGLRSARPLPHRLEPVADRAGVLWVDDSKATNVAAARSALRSLDRPVVLLLGGKDKGEDFGLLSDALFGVRAVVAYGAAGARIARELRASVATPSPSVDLVEGDLSDVVALAGRLARPGDVVLLSPACSSFDMFESYEHRGRAFAELARGRA